MPTKRDKLPSKQSIVDAWWDPACRYNDLPREWGDTPQQALCCWRCGHKTGIERAHLHAHCFGGSNDPLNLVLLCCACHITQPDGMDRQMQIEWIRRGEPNAELESQMNHLFAMAGTTPIAFAQLFGQDSLHVFRECARQSLEVTAGPSNCRANLAAIIRQRVLIGQKVNADLAFHRS
jgi:hypothetical protein